MNQALKDGLVDNNHKNMSNLCKDIPNICHRYAKGMLKIFQRYTKDMPKMWQRYAKDMPKIC